MDNKPDITFWGAGTMRTFRPIWVAEELGLSYQHKPIGPRTGETQTESFTRMNPKQKIPYMVDGALKMSESIAISRYLIARYGGDATMMTPASLEARSKEDEWVCYVYGELDETSLYVMRRHRDLPQIYGEAPEAVAAARDYAMRHFAVIDEHMSGRQFVLGEQLGLADIVLMSCIDWAVHYDFDLPGSLLAYREQMADRTGYRRARAVNFGA